MRVVTGSPKLSPMVKVLLTVMLCCLVGCGGSTFSSAAGSVGDDGGQEDGDASPEGGNPGFHLQPEASPSSEAAAPEADPLGDAGAVEASPADDAAPEADRCASVCTSNLCGSYQGCDCGSCSPAYAMCGDNNLANRCGDTCLSQYTVPCQDLCGQNPSLCPTAPQWGVDQRCVGLPYTLQGGAFVTRSAPVNVGNGCWYLGSYTCCG